jgi:hypothetical protein
LEVLAKQNKMELELEFVMCHPPNLSIETNSEVPIEEKKTKQQKLNLSLGLACTTKLFLALRID